MKLVSRLCAGALFALLAVSANAAHITVLAASIDGDQHGNDAIGLGSASMTFNSLTNEFIWFVGWQDLTGPPTAAHFHGPAAPGMNAGVQITIDHTSNPAIGSAFLTGGQATDLLAGLWYVNIHTEAFPGGEIRGQVLPLRPAVVPLPAAAWLFLSAIGGLAFTRRRQ